ncbi:polycystic kidney disease protein 1-like 2 [Gouania willdenowi]|uniref:polycystic kidney disease protein 1-like 2 n=1 Tax=Gouania willdenowi TaxID=441366 RepID=UPI0010564446|nr:polycystic kidney disease protein 1-like 2 [Gouania willdenowi]
MIPKKRVPKKRLQKKRIPKKRVPKKRIPKKKVPKKRIPKKKVPKKRIPKKKVPKKRIPKKRVPKKKVPKKRIPKKKVPKKRIPKKRIPKKRVPKKRLQKKRIPKKRVPKKRLQKKRLQKKRIPKKRVPKKRIPKKKVPKKRIPRKNSKEEDSKEKDSKEKSSKEEASKEEASKEEDSKEKSSKEEDSKEKSSKEEDSKEKSSKEEDSKEEGSKEKSSKEEDSKEKSSKEEDSKEEGSKEKSSKEEDSKEKDSKEKSSKEEDSKENDSKEKSSKEEASKEEASKEKDSKEKSSKEEDSKEKSSKEEDSKEKSSKEEDSKEEGSKEKSSKEEDSKEKSSKEEDSKEEGSKEKSSKEEDSKEKSSKEEDSKEKSSKEEDYKEKDSKEKSSKEEASKEEASKEEASKEKDSKEKSSKEEDSKEKDSKEKSSKEEGSKEEPSKEEASKEKDSKEKSSKEEDSKEKDSKEQSSKEEASKEKDSKEKSSKEEASKEKDSKEKDSKEKSSKEEASKEEDSKEKSSKEENSKEKSSKEEASKEKDSKEKSSKEEDSKEKSSKEEDSKEKSSKEEDSKEKSSKEEDSKEKSSKEEGSKEKDSKEKSSKEEGSKEKSSKEEGSKEKDSKEKSSKEEDSKEKDSKEKSSKEEHSKEKDSKEKDSKEKSSKEEGSKENGCEEKDSKEKHSKEKHSKEKDSKEKDSTLSCTIKPKTGTVFDAFTITCQTSLIYTQSQYCFRTDGKYLLCSDVPEVKSVFLPPGGQSCDYTLKIAATLKHGGDVFVSPIILVQVRDSNTDFSSVDDLRRMIEEVVTLLKEQSQLSGATLGQLFDSVAKKMNSQLYESQKSDVEKLREELLLVMAEAVEEVPALSPGEVYVATRGLNALVQEDSGLTVTAQEQASSLYVTLSSSLLHMDQTNADYNEEEMTTVAHTLTEGISDLVPYSDNKKVSDSLITTVNNIQSALLLFKDIDEEPTIITQDGICILVKRATTTTFKALHYVDIIDYSCAAFSLPPLPDSLLPSVGPVTVRMFSVDKNIYSWREKGNVSGTLGDLSLVAEDGSVLSVKNLSEDIEIYLPRPVGQEVITSVLDLANYSTIIIDIPFPNSTLLIKMMPSRDPLPFKVFLEYLDDSNKTSSVAWTTMPQKGATPEERYTWLVPPESLHGRIGPHSLLIRPIVGNGIKSITGSLSVTAITASCKYWVPSLLDWSNEGCRVGYNTSSSSVHCLCNHLTTFGGSFFVTPNLVDPSRSAELFATFADNPVVVCFVMALVILYFLVLVWARWKDVKDTSKVNVTVLRDNNPLDRYYYLLSVKTGHRIGASTSSQVTITLLGAETNSEPHHLTDAKKQVFQRGAMDMFLLSTPFSLGNLQAIRMWHNNSGNSPDWFVSSVSVQDLQTKQKWYFLCNCWLSVDQDDCALDKVIPLPTELELKKFSHLFFLRTTRDFSDGHLWLSVVARPPSSTFTCVQRVSCCFSLLLCTMLTSIMFYGIPTDPSEQTLDLGHFEFTWQQFMVGVQSSLIMFPVNILIVGIFRWTRPRETPCCQRKKKKPKTTLEEVINSSHTAAINTKANITVDTFIMDITRLSRSLSETLQINSEFEPEETNDINAILSVMEDAVQQNYKTSEKILPRENSVVLHPVMVEGTEKKTQYVFDQLCHIEEELVLLGPENFPTANSYSQAVEQVHGMKKLLENQLSEEENLHKMSTAAEQSNVDEKKKKKKCCAGGLPWWFVFFGWLLVLATSSVSAYFTMLYGLKFGKERSISWLVSLVVSFFQSLLLIQPLKVICFAVFFALVIKKVDDEDDHEVYLNENIGDYKDAHALRRVAGIYEPPPMSDIERMKRNRILEQKAFALFWEIITYLCFMWMLLLVAYGQRDPNAYFLNQHIRKSFSGNTLNSLSISDVFTWANTSLIDNLFGVYPGFITDGNSKLVGNARLRQLRVQKNSCKISSYMNQLVSDCHAPYSWDTEDTGFYEPGWHRIVTDNSTSSSTNCSSSTSSSPWTYQTQEQLRSHPTWGRLGVYRGGGFVVELGPDLTNASSTLEHLFSSKWLDTYTRALIVEFTVYNANVNLFCMVTLMLETAAVGVFQFHNELQSIRLYQSTSGLPIFVMAAEIIYLLFVLYYMFLQGKLMRTQRWMYFKNMWNLLELSIIMLTWSAVAVFIIRTVFGNRDLDYYQNHKDKFASFYQTASADCVLNYLIAFIVLLSTVKLWRLLRLNSKMNMLTATLQRASGDIFSFLVVIIVMLIAYSFTSNVLYGWKISSYKTLFDAVMTIICLQVGMFNYSEVLDNTSLLGGLLFGSCVIFMTYVVLNLFISVILVAFNEEQIHHKPSEEEEVVDVMLSKILSLFGIRYIRKKHPETDVKSSSD